MAYSADIDVRVKGLADVDKLNKQLQNAAGGVDKLQRELNQRVDVGKFDRTAASITKIGAASTAASRGVRTLATALGALGGAIAVTQVAKGIFGTTAELEKQSRSLRTLTGSAQQTTTILKQLQAYANVTPFETTELVDTTKKLLAFGVQASNAVAVTKQLGDIAAATGQDLGGIATAYGQIQAKGRLQGEELLQLQERGIPLQQELQRMYKLSGAEFQKALEGGRISQKAVEQAFGNLTAAGGKFFGGAADQADTLNGKLSTLVDSVKTLARTIGAALTPAIKGALDFATRGATELQKLFDQQNNQRTELGYGQRADAAISKRYGPLGFLTKGGEMADQRQRMIEQFRADDALRAATPAAAAAARNNVPPPLLPDRRGGAGGAGGSGPTYISIEQLGKALQAKGFTVKEHPAFGGVGRHAPNSYHYFGEALDVTDWRGGDWKGRTRGLIDAMRGSGAGFAELLGPGDPGHSGHAHMAMRGGKVALTDQLAQILGLPGGGERGLAAAGAMGDIWSQQQDAITKAADEARASRLRGLDTEETRVKALAAIAKTKTTTEIEALQIEKKLENDLLYIAMQRSKLEPDPNVKLTAAARMAELAKQERDLLNQQSQQQLQSYYQSAEVSMGEGRNPFTLGSSSTPYLTNLDLMQTEATKLNDTAVALADSFANAFQGIVSGSQSADQAMKALFNNISGYFLDMASKMLSSKIAGLLTGLFSPAAAASPIGNLFGAASGSSIGFGIDSLIPGFAAGGQVPAGQVSIVGEEGPELFIPGVSGSIVPNDMSVPYLQAAAAALQGEGSSAGSMSYPGAPGAAGAAGRAGWGAAGAPGRPALGTLQVPWQKPSGGGSNDPAQQAQAAAAIMQQLGAIDVKYQAEVINETRYVDEAQAQQIGRESAQRGAQIALAALQNSVGTRRRVGI
jgi:tape measure domain-containing protein